MNFADKRKYITVNASDYRWGMYITSIGRQVIAEGEDYPPNNHPARYIFNTTSGRILNEFQLLYITKGKGSFSSASGGRKEVKEGYFFLLFPGEWHTYKPDPKTGWNEYWIGFDGDIIQEWVKRGFFRKEAPVFNVGMNEEIISLYKRAIIIADAQEANYQQALAGIVINLLSSAVYLSKNREFSKSDIVVKINQAKACVMENIAVITPEALAENVCMGYSNFRKVFKSYTGFAPSQYIQEVKINLAKELLTHTSKNIKEIAYELGFENSEYFFTVFRKRAGITPQNYRKLTQGEVL